MTFCSGQLLCKNSSRGYKSRLNHVFNLLFPGTIRSDLGDNLSGWNRMIGLLFLPFTRWVTMFRLYRSNVTLQYRVYYFYQFVCYTFVSWLILYSNYFGGNKIILVMYSNANRFFFIHAHLTQVCILRCSDDPLLCSRWRCCGTQWWILLWLCQARVVSSRQRRGNGEETLAGKRESYKTCVNGQRLLFVSPITPYVGS